MENTLTFLGTGGARIMVANQIRASGGIWLNLNGTQILIDPGPGCIVQSTKRKLRAEKLSAIILSHRHLDHSGDMNIMVESMTQGGFNHHGRIFLPSDALGPEPVVYSYLKKFLDGVEILEAGKSYSIDNVTFSTPVKHIHPVETYGLKFGGNLDFSYIADTLYFDELCDVYRSKLILINVVFYKPMPGIAHLAVEDVRSIIEGIRPEVAILTHYGMSFWRAKPWVVAEELTQQTSVKVVAARDGMKFDLDRLETAE
jgi:phosphoribosyl 1,2-cyclic phosphodiesterase